MSRIKVTKTNLPQTSHSVIQRAQGLSVLGLWLWNLFSLLRPTWLLWDCRIPVLSEQNLEETAYKLKMLLKNQMLHNCRPRPSQGWIHTSNRLLHWAQYIPKSLEMRRSWTLLKREEVLAIRPDFAAIVRDLSNNACTKSQVTIQEQEQPKRSQKREDNGPVTFSLKSGRTLSIRRDIFRPVIVFVPRTFDHS